MSEKRFTLPDLAQGLPGVVESFDKLRRFQLSTFGNCAPPQEFEAVPNAGDRPWVGAQPIFGYLTP